MLIFSVLAFKWFCYRKISSEVQTQGSAGSCSRVSGANGTGSLLWMLTWDCCLLAWKSICWFFPDLNVFGNRIFLFIGFPFLLWISYLAQGSHSGRGDSGHQEHCQISYKSKSGSSVLPPTLDLGNGGHRGEKRFYVMKRFGLMKQF